MGRLVFVYIASAVLLLALPFRSPIPTAHHSNRRLEQFPSTSEERRRRDDEDVSNVNCTLAEQFRKVDVDPTDGFLSRHELIRCNLRPPHRKFLHRYSRREMHLHDKSHDDFVSFSEEIDTDRDGKISFQEFYHRLFDLARKYDEESKNDSQHYEGSTDAPATALFAQLDKDGDGYLSHLELLPVIGKIHPFEYYYAKQQADYIISQDDADKDGRLTLTEITYKFYRGMYSEYEDEYDSHDESY